MVTLRLQLLFEDRKQFEDAREVLPAVGSRYLEPAFVAAVGSAGDIDDEPHAISPSVRAGADGCCLQGAPMGPEVTDSLAGSESGISLGFSLGRDPWVWVTADKGGELMAAVNPEFCEDVAEVILDGLRA